MKESSSLFHTAMHNTDRPNRSPSEIGNMAPGEGQIPISFTSESNWKALPREETTLMRNKKSQ